MIKPYYQDKWVTQYCSDALSVLTGLESESIDLLATDPPYGISFMGKDWDKALPDSKIWAECLRILKPGAFAFVMSIPRSDCLSRMVINLEEAGFRVNFTPIYWAYASGFPKAQNIGKAVDKRLGVEREVVGKRTDGRYKYGFTDEAKKALGTKVSAEVGGFVTDMTDITAPATPQAKALDGSYGGFQPKPAVEVIIVAMKPLSEKTFVDQALKNRKGITWLDDCRVPGNIETTRFDPSRHGHEGWRMTATGKETGEVAQLHQGRFPANLLVSDDVLNDGRVTKSGSGAVKRSTGKGYQPNAYGTESRLAGTPNIEHNDSGSFSRYFDLDSWAKTLPFLIVAKASKREKNKGLGVGLTRTKHGSTPRRNEAENKSPNDHPTVKPLKLMSYLITLGSREGDTVLDPFMGSGTTALASKLLNRHCIGIEIEEKYCEIAAKRCQQEVFTLVIEIKSIAIQQQSML